MTMTAVVMAAVEVGAARGSTGAHQALCRIRILTDVGQNLIAHVI